jgi:hypothetical protein
MIVGSTASDADPDDVMVRPNWSLPAETQQQVCNLLAISDAGQISAMRAGIEYLASVYLRWRKQEKATPEIGKQARHLGELTKAAENLLALLQQLERLPDAEFALRLAYWSAADVLDGDEAGDCLQTDILHVHRITRVAAAAHGGLKARSGPTGKMSLNAMVKHLCLIVETLTVKPATHNPYKGTEYDREPQSTAGKFAAIVARAIDPTVTLTQIKTAMRHAVRFAAKSRLQNS